MTSLFSAPMVWILAGVGAFAILGVVALVLGATASRPHRTPPPGPRETP